VTLRSIATATLPAANRFALLSATSGVIWALVSLVAPLIAGVVRRLSSNARGRRTTGEVTLAVTVGRALDAPAHIPRGSDSDRGGSAPRWWS